MKETLLDQVNLMHSEHLSAGELLVVQMLLCAQEDNDFSYLTKYLEIPKECREDMRTILMSLKEKGVILQTVKIPEAGEKINVNSITFNKNFVKRLHKANCDLGKELFEAYPTFCFIDGNCVQINTVSKKFNSLEDAFMNYGRAIKNNPEEHKKVIELVNWAKENNMLNCSLASFIIDRRWVALEQLRDGNVVNINFDSVKII